MAATARKLELNALLNPIQKTVSGLTAAARNAPSVSQPTNLSSALFQFSVALFIIFAVLIVIHYAITPIFQFRPGDGGLIPLGANGGGQVQWTEAPPISDLSANIIRQLPSEFTIQQDICIQNPTTLSNRKRIFSYRANTPIVVNPNQPENLLVQYPDSNLFMYLSPTTNDLIITAVTKKPNNDLVFESVPTMLNVPTNEVFRLTVVLLPQMMEVYLNGKLYGTRTFRYTLLTTNTYFFPTPEAFRDSVRVMNFKYWDRGLSSVEIKNSTPSLPPKELFFPKDTATAKCS
jgi:hypothetical protein